MRLALEEANGFNNNRRERGWKLFMPFPTFALVQATEGREHPLAQRFQDFAEGRWMSLLRVSRQCTDDASRAQSRKRRRHRIDQDLERRAARGIVCRKTSSGRGESVAPGTQQTLESLRDPNRRSPRPVDALPVRIMDQRFQLDEHKFATNLRDTPPLFSVGRTTGTTSPSTECQRHHPIGADDGTPEAKWRSERHCGGGHCSQVGRAGTECVAHALQVLTELDHQATIVSIDGVGAYDSISRKAMLEALFEVPGHLSASLLQAQGDAMKPLLFALGQHAALEAVQIRVNDCLHLDDVYVLTTPDRVGDVYRASELYRHCRIRIHVGKTQVWNAAGIRPPSVRHAREDRTSV